MDKPIKLHKIDESVELKKYSTILITNKDSYTNCLSDLKDLGWRWADGSEIVPSDDFFFTIYDKRTMLMAESPITISVHDVKELVHKEDLTYKYFNNNLEEEQ